MKAKTITKLPGPKSTKILAKLKKLNGGYAGVYPFIHSHQGKGSYFKDIDNNIFLDFASQVSSNPLGYNHPNLKKVLKSYSKTTPIKYAGQDFPNKEHLQMLEELLSTTPKNLNTSFLINSGAEAVENAIKLCMRKNPKAKYGISFKGSFHGRTLGALSLTDSKEVQKRDFFTIPTKHLPFSNEAPVELLRIFEEECSPHEIAFIILEHVQGEGGYNVAPTKMVKEIRRICKKEKIPYIADEVQSGMGRTGEWWAFSHFDITPNVFSSAKALNIGAVIANKNMFPKEQGTISSTWGGGHILDMALGIETIRTIKKQKLLTKNKINGIYIAKHLKELQSSSNHVWNPRGIGLMRAFDLPSSKMRDDVVTECLKNGLVVLGCGKAGIRLIPPYIITKQEIDQAFSIINQAVKQCSQQRFKHKGHICKFVSC
tara:strand:- start:833 stop:2119 length:1287 start_codon:yes stop_codon:yes gene_type:complete